MLFQISEIYPLGFAENRRKKPDKIRQNCHKNGLPYTLQYLIHIRSRYHSLLEKQSRFDTYRYLVTTIFQSVICFTF